MISPKEHTPSVLPEAHRGHVLAARAKALAYSPRVPFEVRSRLLYLSKRRSWPTGEPQTFGQKLVWKMTKDRRPLLTTFADKVAMRDYVTRVVGGQYLTELYTVVEDPDTLAQSSFPDTFVVKPSHASGMLWLVDRPRLEEEGFTRLSTQIYRSTRGALDWDRLRATCRFWLSVHYADHELEWAYRDVPPRIIVEELLDDPHRSIPVDYKLFVLNGRVRLLEIHGDRFGQSRCDLVLPDGTLVATNRPDDADGAPVFPPQNLDRMIAIAEALGAETDFVRVDLYDIAGRIVVGELTNYPGGPRGLHDPPLPPRYDAELGRYWVLPSRY